MPTALITGANRGIGLELTRAYAADGYKVHACCRTPQEADELKAVQGDVRVHQLDVTNHGAVDTLAGEIGEPVDVLIANAGVYGPKSEAQVFGSLDYDAQSPPPDFKPFSTSKGVMRAPAPGSSGASAPGFRG